MARPMVFLGPAGAEILVGRNAAQNNMLTRAASHVDIWMHAAGPGAHVILKTAGEPCPSDVQFAAALAVYWSKARGSKTPVSMARVADVSTRRDGSATLAKSKTVIGKPMACAPVPLRP